MLEDEILEELYSLPQETLHKILQELVNELLCPVSRAKWKKIRSDKRCDKAIYNQIKSGKIKNIDIAGRRLPYVNWNYL